MCSSNSTYESLDSNGGIQCSEELYSVAQNETNPEYSSASVKSGWVDLSVVEWTSTSERKWVRCWLEVTDDEIIGTSEVTYNNIFHVSAWCASVRDDCCHIFDPTTRGRWIIRSGESDQWKLSGWPDRILAIVKQFSVTFIDEFNSGSHDDLEILSAGWAEIRPPQTGKHGLSFVFVSLFTDCMNISNVPPSLNQQSKRQSFTKMKNMLRLTPACDIERDIYYCRNRKDTNCKTIMSFDMLLFRTELDVMTLSISSHDGSKCICLYMDDVIAWKNVIDSACLRMAVESGFKMKARPIIGDLYNKKGDPCFVIVDANSGLRVFDASMKKISGYSESDPTFKCELRMLTKMPTVHKNGLILKYRVSDSNSNTRCYVIDCGSASACNILFEVINLVGHLLFKVWCSTVASLEEEQWFNSVAKRADAEEILLSSERTEGEFVLRCSESRPFIFSLSVRVPGPSVYHYSVPSRGGQYFFRDSVYSCIQALIRHYGTVPICKEHLVCLRLPSNFVSESEDMDLYGFLKSDDKDKLCDSDPEKAVQNIYSQNHYYLNDNDDNNVDVCENVDHTYQELVPQNNAVSPLDMYDVGVHKNAS